MLTLHRHGNDVTIITYGNVLQNAMGAAELLAEKGIEATVLRLLTVAPLPIEQILSSMSATPHVIVLEESCAESGIRQSLAWDLTHRNPSVIVDGIDLGHNYVTHGSVSRLYEHYGLDDKSVADFVLEVLKNEK